MERLDGDGVGRKEGRDLWIPSSGRWKVSNKLKKSLTSVLKLKQRARDIFLR